MSTMLPTWPEYKQRTPVTVYRAEARQQQFRQLKPEEKDKRKDIAKNQLLGTVQVSPTHPLVSPGL